MQQDILVAKYFLSPKVGDEELLAYPRKKWGSNMDTSLMLAAYQGNQKLCEKILKKAPDTLNVTDLENRTAFMWAIEQGHWELALWMFREFSPLLHFVSTIGKNSALSLALTNRKKSLASTPTRSQLIDSLLQNTSAWVLCTPDRGGKTVWDHLMTPLIFSPLCWDRLKAFLSTIKCANETYFQHCLEQFIQICAMFGKEYSPLEPPRQREEENETNIFMPFLNPPSCVLDL